MAHGVECCPVARHESSLQSSELTPMDPQPTTPLTDAGPGFAMARVLLVETLRSGADPVVGVWR